MKVGLEEEGIPSDICRDACKGEIQGYRERSFGLTRRVPSSQDLFSWIVHSVLGRLDSRTRKSPWSSSLGENVGMFDC